jgi:hypothetical protein
MTTTTESAEFLAMAARIDEQATAPTDKGPSDDPWASVDDALGKVEQTKRDKGEAYILNDKGQPVALSERYWIDLIAAKKTAIYDPAADTFYQFEAGLWVRKTRAEMLEIVDKRIREDAYTIVEKLMSKRSLQAVVDRLAGHPCIVRRDAFANPPLGVVLVKNGRLEIRKEDGVAVVDFQRGVLGKPEDLQRVRLPMDYDPKATPTKTLAWLNRIFCDRADDIGAIQKAAGACIYGSARWKKMLVIHGDADTGKSKIPAIISKLIGQDRVSTLESKRLGERFEMRRFVGKVLLTAADVEADFMTRTCSDAFKQLTGMDSLRTEGKNSSEELELLGDKLILATSNFRLRVKPGVDRKAWESRLVYLHADGEPYAESEQDVDFVRSLMSDPVEGSGLLSWAISGLVELLENNWIRSEAQMSRIQAVMESSDSIRQFARDCMETGTPLPEKPGVTISEAWAQYLHWTEANGTEPWAEQTFRELITDAVSDCHGRPLCHNLERGSSAQRGWRGLCLSVMPVPANVASFDPKARKGDVDEAMGF